MKNDIEKGAIQKLFCNTCKNRTNHLLDSKHTRWYFELENEEDEFPLWSEEWEYRFWICMGCDTAVLEEVYNGPECSTDEDGDTLYVYATYPKRSSSELVPKRFSSIDNDLSEIYKEIIATFNSGLPILCAVGLRALLEGICVSKGITDEVSRGFEGKLNELKSGKHLPVNIVDGLHSFKFMGDNAAHRLVSPSRAELKLAIQIMEDLLNFLYEINYRLEITTKSLARVNKLAAEEFKARKGK